MGRPMNTRNVVVRSPNVARIQNTQQQRDETQRRQFALAIQEEAAHKESQVQDSNKSESAQIQKDAQKEKNSKQRKQKKRPRGKIAKQKQDPFDEQQHIDLKID